ncbi:MAG: hypothetical protein MR543_09555 [Robinsoniella sp.]|nr:hypothetical protein [Robinsoniella sp.]
MAYYELIKSFAKIRGYLREFYVYGFKHRMDMDAKSARSYDNERRRVESWLGDYMRFAQDADGKRMYLSVDSRMILQNPLYKAFKAKSFTDNDVMLHFYVLDLLPEEEGLTIREVIDDLEVNYLEEFDAHMLDRSMDDSICWLGMQIVVSLSSIVWIIFFMHLSEKKRKIGIVCVTR